MSNYYTFEALASLPLWDYAASNIDSCPPSGEPYGMRIWDEQSRLAFDSGTKVLKLLGVISSWSAIGNYPQWRSYIAAWPYPVGQNYGFIASNLPMQSDQNVLRPLHQPALRIYPGQFGWRADYVYRRRF